MAQATAVILQHRGVLKVTGADRGAFLQGIVSNDVERVTPERAVWSAFLTPQGKFLHEFFLAEQGAGEDGTLLLDCEAERAGDLLRRLKLYKLRAQVALEPADDLAVAALFGEGALAALGLAAEPRSEEHTSELQSLMRISYAVFCLKKKKKKTQLTNK